jgi:hypothetical protein
MKTRKILNNQKPIEYDIHLKYLCNQCGDSHWLSITEASTKKFKIVCYCGNVFGVKRVKDFDLRYFKKNNSTQQKDTNKAKVISNDLLDQSIEVFIQYGFTKSEAKDLILESYSKSPADNPATLVKQTLELLRSKNVS